MELHIGIDDTDSKTGGCTTYVAARLVEKLSSMNSKFIDYPNIVRLNPNIPYKTRGNAAAALRLRVPNEQYGVVQETVIEEVEENSQIGTAGTDPAVVFLKGKPSLAVKRFSRKALCDLLSQRETMKTLKQSCVTAVAYGTKLGLVGALSAIGQTLPGDHTFELVAYREKKNWGTPRRVNERSVMRMDRLTSPGTFNNYDFGNRRMLVTPHGPDPVLLGIRGENPRIVVEAFRMLKIQEPVERWVVFRTNHGTDAHLKASRLNDHVKPFRPAVLRGFVADNPERISGGHVFFTLRYGNGAIRCAAFEPTGRLREITAKLIPGDEVTVLGGAKKHVGRLPIAVNLEKLFIHSLADEFVVENPTCPRCGKRLKSAGKGQGFRCERCSFEAPTAEKKMLHKQRQLQVGLYLPDMKAHRHLTKPISRYGFEKKKWSHGPLSSGWHDP